MKALYIAALAAAAVMGSCSEPQGWSVSGTVGGAPEETRLALENFSNGRWLLVDSLDVDGSGSFGYTAAQPARYAELMRLTLSGRGSIYFPVDSSDNVMVETDYDTYGHARVSGTVAAQAFTRVDSTIAANGNTVSVSLQRELAQQLIADTTGIVAYYILSKSIGDRRIFDPDEAFGNRIYGAAAQVFAQYQPDDPRGLALRQSYFDGRRALGRMPQPDSTNVLEVTETGVIDIVRYDYAGTRHSLAELAGSGKVILLSFTAYDIPQSPDYNAILHDLYTRYHDNGLEIYQLAFDESEVDWKSAAVNLPWITVWNSPTDGDMALRQYNVGAVPLTYVIDRNGTIGERIVNANDLERAVARYF